MEGDEECVQLEDVCLFFSTLCVYQMTNIWQLLNLQKSSPDFVL